MGITDAYGIGFIVVFDLNFELILYPAHNIVFAGIPKACYCHFNFSGRVKKYRRLFSAAQSLAIPLRSPNAIGVLEKS
jgi:hypothetical protein